MVFTYIPNLVQAPVLEYPSPHPPKKPLHPGIHCASIQSPTPAPTNPLSVSKFPCSGYFLSQSLTRCGFGVLSTKVPPRCAVIRASLPFRLHDVPCPWTSLSAFPCCEPLCEHTGWVEPSRTLSLSKPGRESRDRPRGCLRHQGRCILLKSAVILSHLLLLLFLLLMMSWTHVAQADPKVPT